MVVNRHRCGPNGRGLNRQRACPGQLVRKAPANPSSESARAHPDLFRSLSDSVFSPENPIHASHHRDWLTARVHRGFTDSHRLRGRGAFLLVIGRKGRP